MANAKGKMAGGVFPKIIELDSFTQRIGISDVVDTYIIDKNDIFSIHNCILYCKLFKISQELSNSLLNYNILFNKLHSRYSQVMKENEEYKGSMNSFKQAKVKISYRDLCTKKFEEDHVDKKRKRDNGYGSRSCSNFLHDSKTGLCRKHYKEYRKNKTHKNLFMK